jgi:Na+:H+ antiporter, NhaC family
MVPTSQRQPGMLLAILPIMVLVGLLSLNVIFFGDMATSGANQVALILSAGVAALVGVFLGFPLPDLLKGAVDSISASMSAILILLLIGALAGTWMISGIIPAMIIYGLKILNPAVFLLATAVVCAIVSLATGSSWSTVATVGIALLGIGKAFHMHEGLIAGAIISGAYFGDKISPMSDTTNLAPAMAGTDLFTHIRYMMYTTVPTMVITLVLFFVIGLWTSHAVPLGSTEALSTAIQAKFQVSTLLFIVPGLVIWMIIRKVNAIPALLIGSLLGGIFAVIFQPQIIKELAGPTEGFWKQSYMVVTQAMSGEVTIQTQNELATGLLKSKGMFGMLNTIWLILAALSFGGIMEASGLLRRITQPLIKRAQSTGGLVSTTAASCVFVNLTASDQYLSIVVPGKMFASTFRDRGLAPQNLSRTLEDAGTVTSVLVPWNTCGATQAAVLGVSTLVYAPFCFFNILSPFMTVLFAFMGIKIAKLAKGKMAENPEVNMSDKLEEITFGKE